MTKVVEGGEGEEGDSRRVPVAVTVVYDRLGKVTEEG